MNSSTIKIAGEDALRQNIVETKRYIEEHSGVQSFNGRSGSVLPMAGDYSAEQVNYDSNQTVKEKIDALVTKEASDIAGQQSLLKDTVGWTGKNLLKNEATAQTINGVTFTVNADKSITVNGTSSGSCQFFISIGVNLDTDKRYILSGCPINDIGAHLQHSSWVSGGEYVIDNGNGVEYNGYDAQQYPNNRVFIFIPNGKTANNLVFRPMIRKADITDPTYEPYHESVEVMYEEEIHGVNLLKVNVTSKTIDGITYTFNANNSVTLNGTSTRAYTQYDFAYKYIATFTGMVRLSGGLSANIHLYPWDSTRGARPYKDSSKTELQTDNQYNSNGDMLFYVEKGNTYIVNPRVSENGTTVSNATMYPMLRKSDIEDSTYRPYNPQAIQNQLNAQGVLGAKNRLKYSGNVYTRTISGVTFTLNSDNSLSLSGTASENIFFNLVNASDVPKSEAQILSGCPKGGSMTTYALRWNTGGSNLYDNGDGVVIPANTVLQAIEIRIQSGYNTNGLIFKPMLRLASDPDDTYQPYAMTNRELTEVEDVTSKATFSTSVTWNTGWNHIYRNGKHVWGTIRFTTPSTVSSDLHLISLPDGLKPASDGVIFGILVEAWSGAHVGVLNYGGGYMQIASNVWAANKAVVCSFNYLTK